LDHHRAESSWFVRCFDRHVIKPLPNVVGSEVDALDCEGADRHKRSTFPDWVSVFVDSVDRFVSGDGRADLVE
jgi:hypothetical protein